MRLPHFITRKLTHWTRGIRLSRRPDFIIGGDYLSRWFITPWTSSYRHIKHPTRWQRIVRSLPVVYVHEFTGSDDDRALHDHPAASMTIVLEGMYFEHVPANRNDPAGPTRAHLRRRGQIVFRRAHAPHRIEMPPGVDRCITLFAFGFRLRRNQHGERDPKHWGFWCKHGWRHWTIFTDPKDSGQTGRGCD